MRREKEIEAREASAERRDLDFSLFGIRVQGQGGAVCYL